MKKGRVNAKYEEKYIKANRTFPVGKTILLVVLLVVQIGVIVLACCYEPQPQDIIRRYDVTVEAKDDGSLDILYHFVWEAIDTSEDLTWIEIGMANGNYSVYSDSVSDSIKTCTKEEYGDAVYLRLDLQRAYAGGEVLEFSFKVNQKDMLCRDEKGYFYEFVPGWFNSTPVTQYTFRWAEDGKIQTVTDAQRQGGFYTWSGSFGYGGYTKMSVRYGEDSFLGCGTVDYQPFDNSGAFNEPEADRVVIIFAAILLAALLVIVQVWVIDSVVSYHRGRGFLTGHGYHVHTYGRSNPWYIKERDKHAARYSGSGGRGGGCACACACACAGGGRAGCSQKDTFGTEKTQ